MKDQWGGGILESKRKNPKELQRFNKNKKQKQILIGSIIGILLIVGGISLYRSFAIYKVEKTFDVLEGTVPDFRKTKAYTEALLKGADPVLDEEGELVPVNIGNNGEVTKADVTQEWYSYANKKWANAVILTEEGKQQNIGVNEKIEEKDIESYFVWIPKYRYKLFDMGNYPNITSVKNKNNQAVEIEFGLEDTVDDATGEYKECKTPMNDEGTQGLSGQSGTCQKDYWMTHPAFISFGVNGLWVGKFETSQKSNTTTPQVKPNQYSWRDINVSTMYTNSYNYKRNLDSHMMKNTEWGAVAYLTQSLYGRCTEKDSVITCENVRINNGSNYVTGVAAVNVPNVGWDAYSDYQSTTPGTDNAKSKVYPNSGLASTTGNNTGIFDMSGGAWEYMASVMESTLGNKTPMYMNSGFTASNFPEEQKYFDIYIYGEETNYSRRILGDATGEMGSFGNIHYGTRDNYISSWYGNYSRFVNASNPWFERGAEYINGSLSGIFAFNQFYGGPSGSVRTFRVVLAP